MIKAWRITDKYSYEGCTMIVFAENRGKAKSIAKLTDVFSESEFVDLVVTRCPQADKMYTEGKTEMDWDDPNDRLFLVRDLDFCCIDVIPEECETCNVKQYCIAYLQNKSVS